MIFGDLAALDGSYTYHRRGTKKELFPDLFPDAGGAKGKISFVKGGLFSGATIGWKMTSVLDIGIDIRIDLGERCFIDRIAIAVDVPGSIAAMHVRASTDGKGFHAVGNGVSHEGVITAVIGIEARHLIVRLSAAFRNIVMKQCSITGHTLPAPALFPLPVKALFPAVKKKLRTKDVVVFTEDTDDAFAVGRLFVDSIAEEFGLALPVLRVASFAPDAGRIFIGSSDAVLPEGFSIVSDGVSARMTASDPRGLVYGVHALMSLIRAYGAVPACTIEDHPLMQIRGIHLGLPSRAEIPFMKRLIDTVLVPMRYNTIFLQITAGMQFDKRPEINKAWLNANKKAASGEWPPVPHGPMIADGGVLSKDDVRGIVDYAKSFGLEVIPEIQSLGHVQYLTMTYPDIAERAERTADNADIVKEDARPDEFYPHCYCPSNEKSYEIIADVIDEIIDVVRPSQYVHMGHDEVYTIGVCPRCKGKDAADLFAMHVTRMHDYLAKKGLRMMMWSDMLQPITAYKTPPAIDRIPKDIVMLDFIWYFHMDKDLEDGLLSKGFQVMMGNMYSSHYPRFETRRVKKGIVGGEVSTWVKNNMYTLAREGKIYDLLYSANMLWSGMYRSDMRRAYDAAVTKMLPRIRSRLNIVPAPSQAEKRSFTRIPLQGVSAPVASGKRKFLGIPFTVGKAAAVEGKAVSERRFPSDAQIKIGKTLDSIVFVHTALANAERIPWNDLAVIASYEVIYADGSKVRVPVEYGGNIAAMHRRYAEPLTHSIYRHEGYIATFLADPFIAEKDENGTDITAYGYEWLNPFPKKMIRSVNMRAEGDTDAAVMLLAMTGVKRT
ncbi:MAG: family 20 glycosylhydrolase [Spirochaetota bacterium]